MREIEVKLKVADPKVFEVALAARGAVLGAPVNQHDRVYSRGGATTAWSASSEGDCVLRIRNQDGKYVFNLKQQQSGEDDNLEYETGVEDGEVMNDILGKLGWTLEVEVRKIRRTAKFGEYGVCLDEVEELGTFAELEKMCPDEADPKAVFEELLDTMESLGLLRADQVHQGYDTQLFFKHHPDAQVR